MFAYGCEMRAWRGECGFWACGLWGVCGFRVHGCSRVSVSADSQETRRKTWWFLKVREVNYVSAAKAPNRKVSDN